MYSSVVVVLALLAGPPPRPSLSLLTVVRFVHMMGRVLVLVYLGRLVTVYMLNSFQIDAGRKVCLIIASDANALAY